ncbi:MAG TPA: hypothetical protein VFC25_11600 [Verrucomicrobiae bacterium]|nr:hypothetical protein [Verrucomicrobiae bacterium]
MRVRVLVLFAVLAAVLMLPLRVDAFRYGFDPNQPIYAGGYLQEDASCPAATHALFDWCTRQRRLYVVFNHMKGVKRYMKGYPIFQGPADTTSCSLPLIDVRRIAMPEDLFPPPCDPGGPP